MRCYSLCLRAELHENVSVHHPLYFYPPLGVKPTYFNRFTFKPLA